MPPADTPPRVSVILRTRHRPDLLRAALRNILDQTYEDHEIVLVDDGDEAGPVRAVVSDVCGDDPRVRLIDRTSSEHGRSMAANAGIRAARGEYIAFHDDDDAWKNEFLERTVAHLDLRPEAVAVSSRTEIVVQRLDASGEPIGVDRGLLDPDLQAITLPAMLRVNRIAPISLLYRAAIHDEVGYIDESLSVLEDWEFYLRMLVRHPIDLLPPPALAEWHHRPSAIGDEGNSIFALDAAHHAADEMLRDRHLREAIAGTGLGTALLVAGETRLLEQRLETMAADARRAHDELLARLDDAARRLDVVQSILVDRTSVRKFLGRLRRWRYRRD